jgi:hypothetical protein
MGQQRNPAARQWFTQPRFFQQTVNSKFYWGIP